MTDIASEYEVTQYKCKVQKRREENDVHAYKEETDAEICAETASQTALMEHTTKGMQSI